jgi:pimeloyl-ACP methyl ester carboxylesterase
MLKILLLLSLLLAGLADAKGFDPCHSTDITTLKLPFIEKTPQVGTFKYSFRFRKSADSTQPLVILLGGGPGDALISLSHDKSFFVSGVPANYNVIYTDQRGEGCNAGFFPPEAFTTEELAHDILAIVRHLEHEDGKPLRYFVYGASYGTVHATVFAHLAEQSGTTPPQAIVLEGVVGHAFGNFQNYFKEFQREWNRVKAADLSPLTRQFLEGTLPIHTSAQGFSSRVWGNFVSTQLILGYLPIKSPVHSKWEFHHFIDWYLSEPDGQKAILPQLQNIFLGTVDGALTSSTAIFSNLACRELFSGFYPLRDIKNGQLVASGENICHVPMNRPYDSAQYLVKTPIYYFQSPHDPTSTLKQATYHFEKQNRSARRAFVTVERASHAPLSLGLSLCSQELWESITKRPDQFKIAITACQQIGATPISMVTR